MQQEIVRIELKLPYRTGRVNCYLIKADTGFVLVDTGSPNKGEELEKILVRSGCNPDNLILILLTHGDFDHTGNALYLKRKFNTKTAMHPEDSRVVERGDMFLNRKKGNSIQNWLVKTLFGFGKSKRFKPDLPVSDNYDLSEFGLEARVVHIPGHSKGSIGLLFADGRIICGDLFENTNIPKLNSLMDDIGTAVESIKKLGNLNVTEVFPGHGEPFFMDLIPTR